MATKARDASHGAVKVGDLVQVIENYHRCGGPACGEWYEDKATRQGEPTHRVLRVFTEGDMITGSNFGYVEVEPLP